MFACSRVEIRRAGSLPGKPLTERLWSDKLHDPLCELNRPLTPIVDISPDS